jgi:anti-sigma factor RsiW
VAYCGTGRPPKLVKAHVRSSPRGQSTQRTAVASCPVGTSLVFGGVIDRVAFVTHLKVPRGNANIWRAIGYIDPHGGYITALAYCR